MTDISVSDKKYSEDGAIIEEKSNFKMKVFANKAITKINSPGNVGPTVNLNNFGDSYTKLSFEDPGITAYQRKTQADTRFNLIVPENAFGLVMIYNSKTSASADCAKIRFIKANDKTADSNIPTPKIFNYLDSTNNT
jgi:hypothetical protein